MISRRTFPVGLLQKPYPQQPKQRGGWRQWQPCPEYLESLKVARHKEHTAALDNFGQLAGMLRAVAVAREELQRLEKMLAPSVAVARARVEKLDRIYQR